MRNPKQFIEHFRLENYGVDSAGKQRADFGSMSRQLKNAIEQLSKGLYEKEIHFIFELIQNAEDNDYETDTPELEFSLMSEDPTGTPNSDGCLCVFNNEVGFSPENIESICQIGGSTKKKVAGYIGEKGIGFKSVFLVSERPHIFSNGFQFCFKEHDPTIELAYIVPYWIDSPPQSLKTKLSGSCILLPLKSGKKTEIERELSSIAPETILFLSKLQGIAIGLLNSDRLQLIRDHKSKHEVDLLVSDGSRDDKSSSYWLLHKDYAVPTDLDEEKRAGVTERTISVAFPINSHACDGRLFAYLPTEVYSGLPFLVNADFILSASRESIQINRAWNQWIRDCVADTVIDGICHLAESDNHSFRAVSFLPLTSELTALPEFLGPICKSVIKTLRERDIVLTDDDALVVPDKARQVTKTLRAIFPRNDRPATFFDEYVFCHPKLEATPEQLKSIGVKKFDALDLRECLQDQLWLESRPESWFHEFLTYLSTLPISKTRWLSKIPFIPTADGRMAAPAIGIFYLKDQSRREQIEHTLRRANLPPVSFVSQPVYDAIASDPKKKIWLDQVAKIQTFSISSYMIKVLIPWADRNVKELTSAELMGVCQMILDNWGEIDESARSNANKKLPLELIDGSIIPRSKITDREILVPQGFDKKTGWQLFLLEQRDYEHEIILNDSYMNLTADKETFISFLECLGAEDFPDLSAHELPLWGRSPEPYSEYISEVHEQFQESSTTTPRINTWVPPSFFFDDELRQAKKHRRAFLRWLEGMIGNRADSLRNGRLSWYYRTGKGLTIPSCLYWYMTKMAWINTTLGLKRPGEAFKPTKGVRELLGNSVPYLQDKISDNLCSFLGLQTEVTNDSIVSYLSALSGTTDADLKTLRRLYEHLDRYAEDIAEEFAENALIYIPNSAKGWYASREVVWQDLTDVFGDMYVGLSTTYEKAGLRNFFLKKIGVSETIGTKELADAWLRLSEEAVPDREKVENALAKIIPEVLIEAESDSKSEWWESFVEEIQVWTLDRAFNNPSITFAGDNDFLRRKLKDDVSFSWKPDSRSHLAMRPLYDALGIRPISEAVSMNLASSADTKYAVNPKILTAMSKRLLSYLVFAQAPDDFADQLNEGALRSILETRECQTADLEVEYKIEDMWVNVSDKERVAFLDEQSRSLILRKDADIEDWLDEAAEGISRALWGRSWKKLNDSVRVILGVTNDRRYKGQKDKRGWSMPRNLLKEVDTLIDGSPSIAMDDEISVQSETGALDTSVSEQIIDDEGHRERQETTDGPESGSEGKTRFQEAPRKTSTPQPHTTQEPTRVADAPTGKRSHKRQFPTFSPKGRSKSFRTNQKINRTRQNPIVTYVRSGEEKFDPSDPEELERSRQRIELGDLAERIVVESEIDAGRQAEQMTRNYPGYDIKSMDRETGEIRFIEVKAVRGPWGARGVGLSATQYDKARERRSAFWLYVVENAASEQPLITRICNPAEKITQYQFDQGWRDLNEGDSEHVRKDEPEFGNIVDELKSYTNREDCRKIIDLCDNHDLEIPEVGYELMSESERVVAEAELAWPNAMIAILLNEQHEYRSNFEQNGWDVFPPSVESEDLVSALLNQAHAEPDIK